MSTLSYDATGAAREALEQHLPALLEDRIATRIFAKDHTLWGPDAEQESAIRLGWVEAATGSQPLVSGILSRLAAHKQIGGKHQRRTAKRTGQQQFARGLSDERTQQMRHHQPNKTNDARHSN